MWKFGYTFRSYCYQKVAPKLDKELLRLLNECNVGDLMLRSISENQITNLQTWINKNGPIKSFNDVLEIRGWNQKAVQKLLKIDDGSSGRSSKSVRQFISPNLTAEQLLRISNPVAIQVNVSGIGWAQINRYENSLTQWGFSSFSDIPKKTSPSESYYLAYSLLKKIPVGDIYVFEAPLNMSHQGIKPSTTIVSYNQFMEFTSMLLALINTSPNHNLQSKVNDDYLNTVYHIKARVPARLFGTLLGSERVASTTIVSTLLNDSKNKELPCSSVDVSNTLKDYYFRQSPIHGEMMGQVLLLALTFMNICVYQNPTSLSVIAPKKKKLL